MSAILSYSVEWWRSALILHESSLPMANPLSDEINERIAKHKDVIKGFVEGAAIEFYNEKVGDFFEVEKQISFFKNIEFRVKKEEPKIILNWDLIDYKYKFVTYDDIYNSLVFWMDKPQNKQGNRYYDFGCEDRTFRIDINLIKCYMMNLNEGDDSLTARPLMRDFID